MSPSPTPSSTSPTPSTSAVPVAMPKLAAPPKPVSQWKRIAWQSNEPLEGPTASIIGGGSKGDWFLSFACGGEGKVKVSFGFPSGWSKTVACGRPGLAQIRKVIGAGAGSPSLAFSPVGQGRSVYSFVLYWKR